MRWVVVLVLVLLGGCNAGIDKGIPYEEGSVKVYFCPRDNCSEKIIDVINSSSEAVCAFYDLDIPEIFYSIRGRNGSIITDDGNFKIFKGYWFVRKDKSSGLMHNKFCVLDRKRVTTGSMNPTENGDKKNSNNLLIIDSKYLAYNYYHEFDEMWKGVFGKGEKIRFSKVNLSGIVVENYFCPEDGCKDRVVELIRAAKDSVHFMTFSFTDRDIAELLVNKSREGVMVYGIMEKQRITRKENVYSYLDKNGVNVFPDNNKYVMHHKVFVIDKSVVVTGSYNPTKNGDSVNDENVLVIYDDGIAEKFVDEFERVKG